MGIPKKLYKYRSLSGQGCEFTRDIFINNQIYFSDVDLQNDPFEGRCAVVSGSEVKGYGKMTGYGIFSMSKKNNDVLMWAHYADSYSGICIEFDTSDCNSVLCKSEKVNYINEYSELLNYPSLSERVRIIALSKSCKWTYEDEYRIIGSKGTSKLSKADITGVILGSHISDCSAMCVDKWISHYQKENGTKVNVCRLKLGVGDFSLTVEDFYNTGQTA